MNLQKKILLGVGVALVLSVLGLFYPASKTVVDSSKVDINAIAQAVLDKVQSNLPTVTGAGSDRFNDCEARNGITQCFTKIAMKTGTSTVCAIKTPNATSTLIRGTARFIVASTSATTVVLTKGATQFATTTLLGQGALGASAQGTLYASTTPNVVVDGNAVFSPSTFFNVDIIGGQTGGANFAGMSSTGVCEATFETI